LGASTARYISSSEIFPGFLASQHDPDFPVLVWTRPALDNFDRTRRTKLGLVFTLLARVVEVRWRSGRYPKPAIICTAIENCVLVATIVTLFITEWEVKRNWDLKVLSTNGLE